MDNIAAEEQAKSPSKPCMVRPFARCSIGRCRVPHTGRRSVPRITTRSRQESTRGLDDRLGVLQEKRVCVGGKHVMMLSLNRPRSRVRLSVTGAGSGTRFVHGFVYEMRRDSLRRWRRCRRGQMLAVCPPRSTDCVALQDRPVKGSFAVAVADAMAQAPPWTVPPFQAVSGSYRMRHPHASASQPRRPTMAQTRFTCTLTRADEPPASPTPGSRSRTPRAPQLAAAPGTRSPCSAASPASTWTGPTPRA